VTSGNLAAQNLHATGSLLALLRAAESTAADRPVLLGVGDRRPLSFSRLMGLIEEVSRSLCAAGLRPGDRVALSLPDGPETAAAFLAVSSVLAAAPLHPGYKEDEVAFFLSDLKARAILLPAGVDSPARRAARRTEVPVLDLVVDPGAAGAFRLASAAPGKESLPPARPEDVALLLHTSGTTARPKLVPLTQANLAASARHVARTLELTPADRCLAIMPLFHIHGLVAALLSSLSAGASVACTSGFDATAFFDWWEELEPTWYTAVPTMHQAILARAPRHAGVLARNRRVLCAPPPPRSLRRCSRSSSASSARP
jgi:acyl-CoA synthetase (AMP-forming)/AMP-acid ligase II